MTARPVIIAAVVIAAIVIAAISIAASLFAERSVAVWVIRYRRLMNKALFVCLANTECTKLCIVFGGKGRRNDLLLCSEL